MDDSRLPASFMTPGTSSFADFLAAESPDLLPARRAVPQGHAGDLAPHGTTIVAATIVVPCGARSAAWPWGTARRDGSSSGDSTARKSEKLDVPGVMYDAGRRESVTGRPSG